MNINNLADLLNENVEYNSGFKPAATIRDILVIGGLLTENAELDRKIATKRVRDMIKQHLNRLGIPVGGMDPTLGSKSTPDKVSQILMMLLQDYSDPLDIPLAVIEDYVKNYMKRMATPESEMPPEGPPAYKSSVMATRRTVGDAHRKTNAFVAGRDARLDAGKHAFTAQGQNYRP